MDWGFEVMDAMDIHPLLNQSVKHYVTIPVFSVMFFRILKSNIPEGFSYHPKCSKFELSHLACVDDLFIMCGADASSF